MELCMQTSKALNSIHWLTQGKACMLRQSKGRFCTWHAQISPELISCKIHNGIHCIRVLNGIVFCILWAAEAYEVVIQHMLAACRCGGAALIVIACCIRVGISEQSWEGSGKVRLLAGICWTGDCLCKALDEWDDS